MLSDACCGSRAWFDDCRVATSQHYGESSDPSGPKAFSTFSDNIPRP